MITNILQDIPHKIVQLPAKTILLEAGDVASNIYIVKSGCLRSWYNANGNDITLQFFMPGQPVASFESLVNLTPSEYSIETLLPAEVVVVNGLDFKNWIESHPEYHLQGIHFAMERLSSYQKLFLSRIKDTPQQRYEALLKEQPDIVAQISTALYRLIPWHYSRFIKQNPQPPRKFLTNVIVFRINIR